VADVVAATGATLQVPTEPAVMAIPPGV
jgi:hypothetical protein